VQASPATSADAGESPATDSGAAKIALLLPQSGVPRFERWDRVYFEQAIKADCPDCEVLYYNAQNEDAARQQQQAEAALANGAEVLVVCPVDGVAAKVIADMAAEKNVPVISYERLIMGSDNVKAFTTHDGVEIGELQAATLVEGAKALGIDNKPVLMVNGSPTTSDAALFKTGAEQGFQAAGFEILDSFDTPGWDPAKAQAQMDQWITKYGNDGFGAVYAANGGTAGGVIAAMKAAGIDPSQHPVSGQDADVSEVQRILTGEQFMSIFRPLKNEAILAAQAALALVNDQPLPDAFSSEVDNGSGTPVPAAILPAVAIQKDNIRQELVDSGYYTIEEICVDPYGEACKAAGLQ
jgi:D-xylose transport system substrate-binding protein